MTANIAFSDAVVFVDCVNECGNETHPLVPECGDCMEVMGSVITRYQRTTTSTRRSFIMGN